MPNQPKQMQISWQIYWLTVHYERTFLKERCNINRIDVMLKLITNLYKCYTFINKIVWRKKKEEKSHYKPLISRGSSPIVKIYQDKKRCTKLQKQSFNSTINIADFMLSHNKNLLNFTKNMAITYTKNVIWFPIKFPMRSTYIHSKIA